ncbi:MAG: heme o synthase [Anaerolineales bacterium]|nr:heme o synthase [Anaerolineales bacterium]
MAVSKTHEQSAGKLPPPAPMTWREMWHTAVVLFKLRIVFLLLLSATGGAFLAARGFPGWLNFGLLLLTGGAAAAGASAINQYYERETDKQMSRTKTRPLASGVIRNPQWVLWVALALIFVPSLAIITIRPWLTFFNLLGAFIYVVIYTIWLKPRTLLNIVIGGAAGSAAVLSGGAAVQAWSDPTVLALAAIMFLWTPSHFWSLAILYKDDYDRSDTPMLPSRTTPKQAAWWVFAHTMPTAVGAMFLAVIPELGWLYFIPVAVASLDMFRRNALLIREPTSPHARSLFLASNVYLMVVLVAIMLATTVGSFLN